MKIFCDKSYNQKSLRKGFTLVELSVTLAVLAIVSVMVISFCVYIDVRTKVAQYNNNVVTDFDRIDYVISNWMFNFDNENYVFFLDGEGISAEDVRDEHNVYKLIFDRDTKTLTGYFDQTVNDQQVTYSYELTTIDTISFRLWQNNANTRCLLTYTIEYEKKTPNNKKESTGIRRVNKSTRVAAKKAGS